MQNKIVSKSIFASIGKIILKLPAFFLSNLISFLLVLVNIYLIPKTNEEYRERKKKENTK